MTAATTETRGRPALTKEPRQLIPLATVVQTADALERVQSQTPGAPISTVSAWCAIRGLNRLKALLGEDPVSMPAYIAEQMNGGLPIAARAERSTWVRSTDLRSDQVMIRCRVPESIAVELRDLAQRIGLSLRTLTTYVMIQDLNEGLKKEGCELLTPPLKASAAVADFFTRDGCQPVLVEARLVS